MTNVDITLFLHGLALKDEIVSFLIPKQQALAYAKNVERIKRVNPNALFEVALSWADYSVIKSAFNKNSGALKVIHAPFVKGDKPNQLSGEKRFVDLYSTSVNFEKDIYKMFSRIRDIVNRDSAITLIFHPLPYNNLIVDEDALANKIVFNLRKICPMLQDFNIYLAIENMPFFTRIHKVYNKIFGTYSFFKKVFEACFCPNVGLTFDFGHANSTARFLWDNNEITVKELEAFDFQRRFLQEVGHRLLHIHFHYNPAHLSSYQLGINRFIHKLQNYDFHDSIKNYKNKDILNISSLLNEVLSLKRFNDNAPLTLTLEVLPRSLKSFSSYLADVKILDKFLDRSVLK